MTAEAAYQGAPGAFSEHAAHALLGRHARLRPCRTLIDVFAALCSAEAVAAVIPLTNSLVGAVPGAAELMAQHRARVIAEHLQPIDQAVIGPPGATIAGLRHLWSHPVALAQCATFLAGHPHITPRSAFDTAGAVADVMARGDRTHAALGSRRAAFVYGGILLAEAVQDRPDNVTRFVLIRLDGPAGARPRQP